MLGGNHFQKKVAKKQRKKDAKKAATGASGGCGSAAQQKQRAQQQKNKHGAIAGPIVSHQYGTSRDSANNRKNVPFANKAEEKNYKRENRIPYTSKVVDPEKQNTARQAGASSAAQRRRVLRNRGGDDLLDHFREKLHASTFRLLNEQLYNATNTFAKQMLSDSGTFKDYHTGYKQQLVQWPMNPNKLISDCLLGDRRGRFIANKAKSMPGHIPQSWVVADMGCGEAQIAAALKPRGYTVHSFDFCALNKHVTVADSANVPLEDNSVDVCVFSLSLMATDYEKSLFEAFRILKPNRLLKIVEVRSRIPFPNRFAEMVASIGFEAEYHDVAGDYFVAFDFVKRTGQEHPNMRDLAHSPGDVLVPSLYKKR